VTIPKEGICKISICQESNQIILCSSDLMIFIYKVKETEIKQILRIHNIKELSIINIYNEYFSFGSPKELRVLKIKYKEEDIKKEEKEKFIYNGISKPDIDDRNFIEIKYEKKSNNLIQSILKHENSKSSEFIEEIPFIEMACFISKEKVENVKEMFYKSITNNEDYIISSNFIKSFNSEEEMSLNCVINTNKKTIIVDIKDNEKEVSFTFLNDCIMSGINKNFIFIITYSLLITSGIKG
jgi:hypothetical protein